MCTYNIDSVYICIQVSVSPLEEQQIGIVAGFLVHSANEWPGSSSDSHKQEFFFSHEISDLSVSTLSLYSLLSFLL